VRRVAIALLLVAFPFAASAQAVRTVDRARVRLADVIDAAPAALAEVDLGPAPPPGGTRVLSRDEIVQGLRRAGHEPGALKLPASVRVVGASRAIGPEELASLARAAIEKQLPAGVTLGRVEPSTTVVVPPRATVRSARLPRPPRQKGPFRTTATLELASDDKVVASVPVSVVLDVSEEAAKTDVARGSRVNLVIERPAIRITAAGVVLGDANVGDVVQVSVRPTGRVVRAKLTGRDEARVMEGS
jgi:hypothetical protein